MPPPQPLFDSIRNILLNDWDPHNASRVPESASTYDVYIPPLIELLQSHAGEEQIIEWLHAREQESMCFPSLGTQRLRHVALKLLHAGGR